MAFAGDAANWVLGGIPGDVHDIVTPDVDPANLMRASIAMADLGDTVASVHLQLNDGIATIKERWKGVGATAFQTDIWLPLNDGLDVLERESHGASSQLAKLAGQAAAAHMQKIGAIELEVQTQLNITAVTWELAPAAGKAMAGIVTNVASRIPGDVVSQLVRGIVDAIEHLIAKVLAAFARLFQPLRQTMESALAKTGIDLGAAISIIRGNASRAAAVAPESSALTKALLVSPAHSWGNPATLADHFARHGADFGASTAQDYADQAWRFLQRSQPDQLPVKIDSDGVIRAYDPTTNEFGAFNPDGTTRTYFAPNAPANGYSTNWEYWLAQPGVAS